MYPALKPSHESQVMISTEDFDGVADVRRKRRSTFRTYIIILLFQNGDVNFDRRDVMTVRYDSALRGIDVKSKPEK